MTQRQTTILGFATLIAVLSAIWVLFGERPAREPESRPLFTTLEDRVRDVAKIAITGPEGSVTLAKDGTVWRVSDKAGYPANRDKIVTLLRGMVASDRLQRKTADPDLLPDVGLGDKAVQLRLADGDGKTVVALNLGKRELGSVGQDSETFVRRPDETASWTVTDLPTVSAEPKDWLEKSVFDLARDRVAALTVTHPDGETVRVGRAAPGEAYTLDGLAEGEAMAPADPAGAAVTALTFVNLKDVAKMDAAPVTGDPVRVRLDTFDGLTVSVRLWPQKDAAWAALEASYDEDRAESEDAPDSMPGAPRDGQAEARALNTRWSGWIYALPAYKGEDLTPRRADLIEQRQADGGAKP